MYKVIFQTGPYFALTNRDTFFPVVEVSTPFSFAFLLDQTSYGGAVQLPLPATLSRHLHLSVCHQTRALTGSDACGR